MAIFTSSPVGTNFPLWLNFAAGSEEDFLGQSFFFKFQISEVLIEPFWFVNCLNLRHFSLSSFAIMLAIFSFHFLMSLILQSPLVFSILFLTLISLLALEGLNVCFLILIFLKDLLQCLFRRCLHISDFSRICCCYSCN